MIAYNKTITKPLPGPVIVNCEPPKIATTVPPTIEAITPEIGGASEAMADLIQAVMRLMKQQIRRINF